ncbi:MAG: bifunctional riboflavin kinase/FAD synthetase [Bacteroidales bacterium]|nr:bifunctional riboflavin kinase/FAD synthetase [Bacteroidales bacterium]
MKIYRTLKDFKVINPVVTVGTFDGVHKGHTKILNKLIREAGSIGGESVVFTLYPHPRKILFPEEKEIFLLSTLDEKIELMDKSGIENLIIYPFTKKFAQLNSCDFIEKILYNKLNVKQLIVGFDHHFGKDRQGNIEILRNCANPFGFDIIKVDALEHEEKKISSTRIRNSIISGDIEKANFYLGYDYFVSGTVVSGKKLGRELGFPTANIKVNKQEKLIPKRGVYAVKIKTEDKVYKGMLNIGTRPTISTNFETNIEVHIFDFNKDLYNKKIRIIFKKYIREEIKFPDKIQLQKQLAKDKQVALSVLI